MSKNSPANDVLSAVIKGMVQFWILIIAFAVVVATIKTLFGG